MYSSKEGKVRRVVTGHTSEGKATIVSDYEIDPLAPGTDIYMIWGADETPKFPDNGSPRPYSTYFPPVGGFRFGTFTLQPQSFIQQNLSKLMEITKEIERKFPDSAKYMEKDHPGMHTTDTIDFEYVISGEVWLELDDGKEVHLKAGDTVVQNGTRHAWHNKGSEPCRMVVCMIGALRKSSAR
jgi:mannose-6-phosphate isomerase-like protein (cupin superfamily)